MVPLGCIVKPHSMEERTMQSGTKYAVIVVVAVVLVALVAWRLKSKGMIGGPKPPDWVLDKTYWKIDSVKPYESVELSLREWKKLGIKDGKYKSPETGEYTMVPRMKCAACGDWIPGPEMPALGPESDPADEEKIRAEYVCPKCGKKACDEGPPI